MRVRTANTRKNGVGTKRGEGTGMRLNQGYRGEGGRGGFGDEVINA